jgi:hypothetical protein
MKGEALMKKTSQKQPALWRLEPHRLHTIMDLLRLFGTKGERSPFDIKRTAQRVRYSDESFILPLKLDKPSILDVCAIS